MTITDLKSNDTCIVTKLHISAIKYGMYNIMHVAKVV